MIILDYSVSALMFYKDHFVLVWSIDGVQSKANESA
jgi:hypothetical protein